MKKIFVFALLIFMSGCGETTLVEVESEPCLIIETDGTFPIIILDGNRGIFKKGYMY